MERSADRHAEVPAAVAHGARSRERRCVLGQLGQTADPQEPQNRADGQAPGIGTAGRTSRRVLVVAPRSKRRSAPAGEGHRREEHPGPPGQIRQPEVGCVPDRAQLLAPQRQSQEDTERHEHHRPQVTGLDAPERRAELGSGFCAGAGRRFLAVERLEARVAPSRGSWSPQWGRDYWLTWSFQWTPPDLACPPRVACRPWYYEHMFAILDPWGSGGPWRRARSVGALFPDERAAERHVGRGAYAGDGVPPRQRPDHHQHGARGEPGAVPLHRSTRIEAAATPACTASPGPPTTTWDWGSARTSSAGSWSRSTPSSGCGPSCARRGWHGDPIAMGTNTDPYQHAEGKYHLTRGIIETLAAARNPFSILTKSTLILRDARAAGRGARARRGLGELLHRHARPRRVAADRAGHSPTGPPGGGVAPADRLGSPAASWWRRCCPGSRTPRSS